MSKPTAFLTAAALLGACVLPAGAADFYDGGDTRPPAYHGGDDAFIDGDRPRVEHRRDLRPVDGYRGGPGPVVFDERGPGPDRPGAFLPPVERFSGPRRPYDDRDAYRPAAALGEGDFGRDPDEVCTVDRVRSITATGWKKIVTRRTCYRR